MNQKKILSFLFMICMFFIFSACQKKSSSGSTNYSNEPRQVKTHETVYQEAIKTLQNKKAEIEKHIKNYELSTQERRSPLDDREASVAKGEIGSLATELLTISENCLKNEEVIKNVSSSKRTYQDYKEYAEYILRKY